MSRLVLIDFIRESNRIEGIDRPPTTREIEAHEEFLARDEITIATLDNFVALVQPGAVLRDMTGLDVRVGEYCPPLGGPHIRESLQNLLTKYCQWPSRKLAHEAHHEYETLHPFTDGNGRSGRVLWLWMMGGVAQAPLGFLHHWYYQSLGYRRRTQHD